MAADARFCSQCGTARKSSTRRKHGRLPPRVGRPFGGAPTLGEAELELEGQRASDGASVDSSLVNVSRGGVGLVCDEPIPVGSRIRAVLSSGNEQTVAEGHVVYCAPLELFSGVPCYRCGISFDDLQDAFVAALAGPTSGVGYLISLRHVAAEQGDRDAA